MNEPVAWGIACDEKLLATYTCEDEESAREMVARFALSGIGNIAAVPLYRSPTLTEAELEAVAWALKEAVWSYSADTGNHRATLRGLLERMK